MRRFENTEGGANKFWSVKLEGNALHLVWGKIGTEGQSKSKTFGSAALAKAEHDKLVKEKLGKGYVEVKPAKKPAAKNDGEKSAKAPARIKDVKASSKKVTAKAAPTKNGNPLLFDIKPGKYSGSAIDVDPRTGHVAKAGLPLEIFDIETGEQVTKLDLGEFYDPIYAPDGALYAEYDDALHAIDVDAAAVKKLFDLPDQTRSVIVTEKHIVAIGYHGVVTWDRRTLKQIASGKRKDNAFAHNHVSTDGETLLVPTSECVEVWSTTKGMKKKLAMPKDFDNGHPAGAVFVDGDKRVIAFFDGTTEHTGFVCFDVKTGKELWHKRVGAQMFTSVDAMFATPDGKRLITAGVHGVAIWSSEGELLSTMRAVGDAQVEGMTSWRLTADGARLACSYKDRNLRIYGVPALEAAGVSVKLKDD